MVRCILEFRNHHETSPKLLKTPCKWAILGVEIEKSLYLHNNILRIFFCEVKWIAARQTFYFVVKDLFCLNAFAVHKTRCPSFVLRPALLSLLTTFWELVNLNERKGKEKIKIPWSSVFLMVASVLLLSQKGWHLVNATFFQCSFERTPLVITADLLVKVVSDVSHFESADDACGFSDVIGNFTDL